MSSLGHPAGTTAGTEAPLLARERHKPREVAFVAAYPQESVFETTALEVGLEFSVDMVGQGFALNGWLDNATSKEAAEPGAIHQMRR